MAAITESGQRLRWQDKGGLHSDFFAMYVVAFFGVLRSILTRASSAPSRLSSIGSTVRPSEPTVPADLDPVEQGLLKDAKAAPHHRNAPPRFHQLYHLLL